MKQNKYNERQRAHRALMEQAGQYRETCAQTPDDAAWNCARGHAWDDSLSAAQNVRCMNCAAQRRELRMQRLARIAGARGGALLSAAYIDAANPLRWQCAFGHVWEARADVVERQWCRACVREGVYDASSPWRLDESSEDMQAEALTRRI
ncbi:hypothetical protein [Caballeronia humi]|uniref:Uncharacterized protein n=1 Tax=Caballeronia humi TaxID=326474 RepID=A0A158EW84_9BURK|nr:hypothetical protein [Caballeronia humi]SAL11796.1 hypothetical protein AWB65_00284 [Caballeronia humi]